LRVFFPLLSESDLKDALKKCELDSQKALELLVHNSFLDHKQKANSRFQQIDGRNHFSGNNLNSQSFSSFASGQQPNTNSMSSFRIQEPKRSKRTRAQLESTPQQNYQQKDE
jgi:hypothetical protein